MKDTKTTLKLADLTWLNSHLISQVQLTDCQTCCSLPVRGWECRFPECEGKFWCFRNTSAFVEPASFHLMKRTALCPTFPPYPHCFQVFLYSNDVSAIFLIVIIIVTNSPTRNNAKCIVAVQKAHPIRVRKTRRWERRPADYRLAVR